LPHARKDDRSIQREIELKKEHCIITSIGDESTLANEEEFSEPAHASDRCGHLIIESAVDDLTSIQTDVNRYSAV
jgi:hypothetical protein